jgi:hypothetical protein
MKPFYCFLSLLLVSCASAPHPTGHRQLTGDEQALVVATFHKFYGLESESWQKLVAETHGQPPPAQPVTQYYVTVLGSDASPSLLAEFKTTKAAFHPGSRFHDGDGVAFSVKAITFDGADSASVEFDHYCGPLCGYGTTYCFERHAGSWQFVKVCGSETMS